jgi:two-component system phosphate regulon sensor histidine kinase PhoR
MATGAHRLRRALSLRGAIITVSVGVLLPVILSTSVGIVALVIGSSTKELLIGVLVVSLTAAAAGSAIAAVVLLGRRARLARLQSDLLANVSHELRTPLAAIRMYAQTLQTGLLEQDPETTRESLDTIVRETEWLEATVDRVLTWRALAKDRAQLQLRPGLVGDAVEDAVARFRRMVAPGEVELEVALTSAQAVAHDRDALSRVVLNLLVNAYKYTRDDKWIRVVTRDRAGLVEVAVSDNGIGIPPPDLERVFDPFYRVEPLTGERAAGAGLGLAIVHHLVHEHGGEIRLDSEVGRGSTFTVTLPAAGEQET